MFKQQSLNEYLTKWSDNKADRVDVAKTLESIASASIKLADLISVNSLQDTSPLPTSTNSDGDTQKPLDIIAHQLFEDELQNTAVGLLASEESEEVILLNEQGSLGVAIDPLDGSSNIDTNLTVGTIFSIFPFSSEGAALTTDQFIGKTGDQQIASGITVFGPQTTLVLTCLNGTHIFALDRDSSTFYLTNENIQIAPEHREFAINASNYHHWDDAIRGYVDDCLAGESGPREGNFNMRWAASLVAEAYRIFNRGGIFLYPRDSRPNYENGRLRLLYEAFPMALLVEQAGGAATDGEQRILDKKVAEIHERAPLIFGSKDKVDRVARYYENSTTTNQSHPLFTSRSLLRN